jgi:DNA-binding NarL/FixJ family response regulator
MERMMSHGLHKTDSMHGVVELTRLELLVLTLSANGLRETEIVARLPYGAADISKALIDAAEKLGAGNRMQAIAFAVRRGLIGIEV